MSGAKRLGVVAGVLVTVVLGPSAAVASALDEANRAPTRACPAASAPTEQPRSGFGVAARDRAVPV